MPTVTRHETSGGFIEIDYINNSDSNIELITVDSKRDMPELFEQKFTINEKVNIDSALQEISGFRVQIFKTEDLLEAKKREAMYIANFGEENVLLVFEKPFYKIRVGRLRNKEDAEDLQQSLSQRGIYGAIIVPDLVKVLMPANKQNK
ncbi:MAG: SPOR domain-containing protein [Candidatus Delongbacteria bacterium]|nr:SPOR domain-containing protein [Candidatus Delongbacteria bacterium]